MATVTTDIPFSKTSTKARAGIDNLEAEAIGLEVPVRINGTQVTAVVMETTEHTEPFQEDTTTMIVFPRGGVVKLLARVRTGQTLDLTNRRTNQKISCRVIQVNSANNAVHYVKLEFTQLSQGFWGIHFPSDPLPVAHKQENALVAAPLYPATPSVATPASVPQPDILRHSAIPERGPATPLAQIPASDASSATLAPPPAPEILPPTESKISEMTFPSSIAPAAPREESKPESPKEETPASRKPIGYGLPRNWQKEQIEPLAGPASATSVESAVAALEEVHPPAAEKIPIPGRRPQPAPPSPRIAKRSQKPVRPVYGELHTFGSASTDAAAQAFPDASLNMSSVAHTSSVPARSRSKLLPALAAVAVLAVVAAGVVYVRRNPGIFASSAAATQAAAAVQPAPHASAPQPVAPSQPAASASIAAPTSSQPASDSSYSPAPAPTVTPSVAARNTSPATKKALVSASSAKSSRAAAETSAASKSPAADSAESGAASVSNLYAGDLNARPEIKAHSANRVNAQVPDISSSAPAGISNSSDSSSLSSLVSGVASGLAAPAAPAPVVRQGGVLVQPKLVSSVNPVYPSLARQNGVEGDVTIQAEIGISGYVTSMKVVSGPLLLREAAMNALRKWRYAPAKLDGKPISTQYNVTLRFRLNN